MNGTLARGDGIAKAKAKAEAEAEAEAMVVGAGATRSVAKLIQRNTPF
ncbi:hypothetical protein IVB38_03340 [Bradyrhizobium sp. 38]|nr:MULTISPECIES: hypothetical protein [unclassified Bradyrhizobium]MCK1335095.1 hypothetical protein [Bradyrhizobium sp. 38]MCK1779162.1 hypothetical protein [Bradyrhizobium sp. 132]